MIGEFTAGPSVKPVAAGERLKVSIAYSALNPGAWYWKTFLIAEYPWLSAVELISATRELGQHADSSVKTYYLAQQDYDGNYIDRLYMPDSSIVINFFLFGHNDAGYDWDWDDFVAYQYGYTPEATPLAYALISLDPLGAGEEAIPVLPDYQTVYIPQPENPPLEEHRPVYPVPQTSVVAPLLIMAGGALLIGSTLYRKK